MIATYPQGVYNPLERLMFGRIYLCPEKIKENAPAATDLSTGAKTRRRS